jgi:glycosyltransferase involved in cell wall biosynthesis
MAAMISFIIPAHNEELWVGKCLGSVHTTMQSLGEPYEVIVVDDASTDSTHQIGDPCGQHYDGCPLSRSKGLEMRSHIIE